MEDMIDKGAEAHLRHQLRAPRVAAEAGRGEPRRRRRPPGRARITSQLDNLGTYFGTVYEPVYLAGIAAGQATRSGKLGYVYAFPIPQTLANINAFTLGAQSVNPDIETIAVSTGSWCDPAKQAEAAQSLARPGRRRDHPAPGLHQDDHRGRRGRRRLLGRLPRRRLDARPEGLDHRLGVGLGGRSTPTSCRR